MKASPSLLTVVVGIVFFGGPVGVTVAAKTQILAEPAEIQGVPCQGTVELSDIGALKSCTLARDHAVAGCTLPTGTTVAFDQNGKVASCVLGQAATIEGFALPTGSKVLFRNSRAFEYRLAQDAVIRGVSLPAKSTVFFWTPKAWESEIPNAWHCWLPTNTLIQGHLCGVVDDGCGDIFYASGKIRAVALAKDEVIDGVPCTTGHNPMRFGTRALFYGLDVLAWFYEDGHLAQGLVARDCTIEGRKFKAGDIVRLTPEGKLDPAGTTLGARSRGVGKRTPPESHVPSPPNSPGGI